MIHLNNQVSDNSEKHYKKVEITKYIPAPHDLESEFVSSARSFSTSRAMETKFFSIDCF